MRLLVGFRFAPHSATQLLAVRHAAEVVERDGDWFESFTSDCWLARGKNAQVQFGHNSKVIGSVDVVAPGPDGWWHGDATINTDDLADDTAVLERIRPGVPVSLGFNPIHSDDDLHLRIRRHDLAELRHIAVLRKGEMPAYAGAKITSVRESKTKTTTNGDWRTSVPAGWECLLELPGHEPQEGDELLLGGNWNSPASHRFVNGRFVAVGARRLAA